MADEELRPDIRAARERLSYRPNREIAALADHLRDGEQVSRLAGGRYEDSAGLLALTNRRLLFIDEERGAEAAQTFDLERISSVRWQSGIMSGEITVDASGAGAAFDKVLKDDGKALVDAVDNAVAGGTPPAAQVAAPPPAAFEQHQPQAPADPLPQVPSSELVRILRDRGVLTPDEFTHVVQRL
ncbi:PH domain-containing protein [Streptomonospora salina]|uniref:YokE-like PH domain-containing protein n=1 Tax=Streptomonospora salina TaxID=104205 RepID=A0A841EBB9_9ACTN|nr:PH domain-containing protein [Streptomonospora salina]MBB5998629.1 hypothetical protein [Streptomonospora salina]